MKLRNNRYFFTEHNARIEELMRAGYSIKHAYYKLIDEGIGPDCVLESFRKAMKRHRPDLHQLVAYKKTYALPPVIQQESERKDTASLTHAIKPPEPRKWKHNKVPDESLFQKCKD